MTLSADSLRGWITGQVKEHLERSLTPPPFLVWCDPDRVWIDLLKAASEGGGFELWADDSHELAVRARFYSSPRSPKVVWLPVSRSEIGYFKVFELEASDAVELSMPQALAAFGVEIPRDQLDALEPILAAYAKEWLERPRRDWAELTPAQAKSTLVDDDRILELLATPGLMFDALVQEGRFAVFARRTVEDFGLPSPSEGDPERWRVAATATLVCTDAAVRSSEPVLADSERAIPPGVTRKNAMKLLDRWLKRIDLVEHFETLSEKADGLTDLSIWARSLERMPAPLASRGAEGALFAAESERLDRLHSFDVLARRLETNLSAYRNHAKAFWGSRAARAVPWGGMVELGVAATLLLQEGKASEQWKTTEDAVAWFTTVGWQLDHAGERLFREDPELPGALVAARVRLRKAYLRHLDRVNSRFAELVAHAAGEAGELVLAVPFSGDLLGEVVSKASTKDPVAVIVLDACRYDLGCRLASLLNDGEPTPRARVTPARAPLPSITPLGMPLALPGAPGKLSAGIRKENGRWQVRAEGFAGDLAILEHRRRWLKETLGLQAKAFSTIANVLASDAEAGSKSFGKLAFVFGDEFDADGHEGQLQLTGADEHLERYARAARRLRSMGYSTVAVVTDHGYFHWDPAEDEVGAKPTGDVQWASRRAVAGRGLDHGSALLLKVTASELECAVPRSVNAFQAYGGLGFFHGGATLQELVIPLLVARWPKKAQKIGVVLKKIGAITSPNPRVEVGPASTLLGSEDELSLARKAVAKVVDLESGKVLFRSCDAVTLQPGGTNQTIDLSRVEGATAAFGKSVTLRVVDYDDEEILDQEEIVLKVDLDEWF